MFLQWFKQRRRKRLLAQPFPQSWSEILVRNVAHYVELSGDEQLKLRGDLRILAAEKHWEGCGGFSITDEVKVTIAGQAALMVLAFDGEFFDMVKSILVYEGTYVAREETTTEWGGVQESDSYRAGEAWYRGPVVLSWQDVLAGGRREEKAENVVLHEFAHQLDMQNGQTVDGTPLLPTQRQYDRWQRVINHEYERHGEACGRGESTLLDCYGATCVGEFFAVTTECFFQQPVELSRRHPELYVLLRDFYRQDPSARALRQGN